MSNIPCQNSFCVDVASLRHRPPQVSYGHHGRHFAGADQSNELYEKHSLNHSPSGGYLLSRSSGKSSINCHRHILKERVFHSDESVSSIEDPKVFLSRFDTKEGLSQAIMHGIFDSKLKEDEKESIGEVIPSPIITISSNELYTQHQSIVDGKPEVAEYENCIENKGERMLMSRKNNASISKDKKHTERNFEVILNDNVEVNENSSNTKKLQNSHFSSKGSHICEKEVSSSPVASLEETATTRYSNHGNKHAATERMSSQLISYASFGYPSVGSQGSGSQKSPVLIPVSILPL